jgi:hypothetical protein
MAENITYEEEQQQQDDDDNNNPSNVTKSHIPFRREDT